MTKSTIHIPPAALEAGTEVIRAYRKAGAKSEVIARAAFVAMVEAWEGMSRFELSDNRGTFPALILPLTEKQDDKA